MIMPNLPLPAPDKLESALVAELSGLLVNTPVGAQFAVEPAADICCSLELLLPRLLAARHPEWARESLDGFFVARAVKSAAARAELVGVCIIISDQTVTPFRLELAMESPESVALESVRIRMGEAGRGELGISGPPVNSKAASTLLANVASRIDSVQWSYDVQFRRRPERDSEMAVSAARSGG